MLKRVLCKIIGAFLAIYSLAFFAAGISIMFRVDSGQGKLPGFIIGVVIGILLGLGARKLFRMSRKSDASLAATGNEQPAPVPQQTPVPNPAPRPAPRPPFVSATVQRQEVPQQVLDGMRMAYTGQQALNDMRIIDESLAVMEKTADLDTFLSRYEIAMRCALTLEQAKKAGVPIALSDGFSQTLIDAKNKALEGVLYRSFQKELNEINKLKTDNGKLNRINKYQNKLKSMYEDAFEFVAEDAYNDVMQKLDSLKKCLTFGLHKL